MADKFIRQLTHDSEQFDKQWSTIFDSLNHLFIECEDDESSIQDFKVNALDALVDYVLAEPPTALKSHDTKYIFIDLVTQLCASDPSPPLSELVRILQRILQLQDIFNIWHLSAIEAIHHKFELCTQLSLKPSVDLIQSILLSLQKHSFLSKRSNKETEDRWENFLAYNMFSSSMGTTNKLNSEETMIPMRPVFQKFFKYATDMSNQSVVWSSVAASLQKSLPAIFDSSDDPNEALAIIENAQSSISYDFLESLAKSYQNNPNQLKINFPHVLTIIERLILNNRLNDARNFICDTIEVHFNTAVDMKLLVDRFARVCPQVNPNYRNEFCKKIILSLSIDLGNAKCNRKMASNLFDFALIILDLYVVEAPKCSFRILEKTDYYPWKELAPRFEHLLQSCVVYENIPHETNFSDLSSLEDILSIAAQRSQSTPNILQATHEAALQAVLRWAVRGNQSTYKKPWPSYVYRMGSTMIELIDRRKITDNIFTQLTRALSSNIIVDLDDQDDDNLEEAHGTMEYYLIVVSRELASYLERCKSLSIEAHQEIVTFLLAAFNQPLKRENGGISWEHDAAKSLWFAVGKCIKSEAEVCVYDACIKRIYSLAHDEQEENFFEYWSNFWNTIGKKLPDTAAMYTNEILSDVIDRKRCELIDLLPTLYSKQPKPFHDRLDDLISNTCSVNTIYLLSLGYLFSIITKEHPEIVTSAHVDTLFSAMKADSASSGTFFYVFKGLSDVANVQPHLFHKHKTQLVYWITKHQSVPALECLQRYLLASCIIGDENTANESLTILIHILKQNKVGNDIRSIIFHTCELIGVINKHALESQRKYFMTFQSDPECRSLLDFLDGKKISAENKATIDRMRKDMAQIEMSVTKTEDDMRNMSKVVTRQELDVANLGSYVNTVDTRLNNVSKQVEVQAHEIERIDAKTLSHVPIEWGSQVCKLLNVRADNDWRLLGKRFGYSNSELKHWSMQADPSMALLNEWFMTHKADEATYGLVKTLDEIGQQKASKIIRQAVTNAGQLIPDDMSFEIKRLPPIFLSYQWGAQKAVMTLKSHLEEAGYACWMDIGQMGGGDKLFAKIDAGIRGAKVVVCCMNAAYAQSDNCSREVHLAISTGKPLIPLQMEKQTWPPEGPLGPIMSEYLYIRFYDRKSNVVDYWPADKFPELLGQIRYHVAPNLDMISAQYQNWFQPHVDNLIFLQATATDTNNKPVDVNSNIPLDTSHPQIMISYQWNRQKDIIALHQRLTKLGYGCWLDIFQMGGGDSLFEKIDNGIRHAQCIIACVTPQYTKSVNCRREMSLSDALGKPIIPLLLEETNTWPPSGPMALVFTDKSYIDFRHVTASSSTHDMWSSIEFNKLIICLQQAIPDVQVLNQQPTGTTSTSEENKARPIPQTVTMTSSSSTTCSIL